MRSPALAFAAAVLFPTALLAAVDIPTRYSGAFPSTANIQRISGTFTGKSLTLKGTAQRGRQVAGRYTCSQLSATQTLCRGTLASLDKSRGDVRHDVTITWTGGKPVSMSGVH